MKYIKIIFLAMVAAVLTTACSDDDLSNTSIFNDATEEEQTEFDKWIYENYTKPYNIDLVYRYQDYETNNQYNVVPADVDKVKALTIIMKHIWVEAYNEVAGEDFLKQYCFRKFQFIGSPEYNENGSIVLGTAEGGLKVTLFVVNWLNPNNIFIDSESPFPTTSNDPLDLNFWYFHTMHHEFCHILTQHKNYSTDFQTISAGKYHSSDWINVEDKDAPLEGFVTGYASGEYNEDFAEIYSTYVTKTDEAWQKILDAGVDKTTNDTSGRDAILAKLDIIKSYFQDSWGIDLDELRSVVLRRSAEVKDLDLKNLK